jgi:hypothetical protein
MWLCGSPGFLRAYCAAFCGILYVGDIAKFPCFCLWQPFGLWLKFSEVYLGCNILLQGIITCVNACSHQASISGMYPFKGYIGVEMFEQGRHQ